MRAKDLMLNYPQTKLVFLIFSDLDFMVGFQNLIPNFTISETKFNSTYQAITSYQVSSNFINDFKQQLNIAYKLYWEVINNEKVI